LPRFAARRRPPATARRRLRPGGPRSAGGWRRLPRGGRGRLRGPVRRPGRRRRRPDPACGGRPPCGRRSPASGSCRSGEPVPAGAAAMALVGGAPCAGITAGGAADPDGLPDAALLLGRVDQFPLAELLEFVLEHGGPSDGVPVDLAVCDASTFVSQGGPPHRETSASSAAPGALDACEGPRRRPSGA